MCGLVTEAPASKMQLSFTALAIKIRASLGIYMGNSRRPFAARLCELCRSSLHLKHINKGFAIPKSVYGYIFENTA